MDEEHDLMAVIQFAMKTVGFDHGEPVRVPITPYWRWYCSCGGVGGKADSEEASKASHDRHSKGEE